VFKTKLWYHRATDVGDALSCEWRRREAGGGMQEAGGGRRDAGGVKREAGCRRQEA